MEELKQSIMNSYQEFTSKFQESSNNFQTLVESEVEGFKSNFKGTLKQNLYLFERAKL